MQVVYNAQGCALHCQQEANQNSGAWIQCSHLDQDLDQDLVEVLVWGMDQYLDRCLDQTFPGAIEKFNTDHPIQSVG